MRQPNTFDYVVQTRAKNTVFIARVGLWLFVALLVGGTLFRIGVLAWQAVF